MCIYYLIITLNESSLHHNYLSVHYLICQQNEYCSHDKYCFAYIQKNLYDIFSNVKFGPRACLGKFDKIMLKLSYLSGVRTKTYS